MLGFEAIRFLDQKQFKFRNKQCTNGCETTVYDMMPAIYILVHICKGDANFNLFNLKFNIL